MKNPWLDLPEIEPFVLPLDQPHVAAFNSDPKLLPKHRLDLGMIPQPYLGNPNSPLVILGRNPDLAGGHRSGPYADAIRRNLSSDGSDASHLALMAVHGDGRNAGWWDRSFRSVLAALGRPASEIAPKVLSVEFHGYHSEKWKLFPTLPSQNFGFWLVEEAVERGATIVLMRGIRDWKVAVPALARHARLVTLNNPRSNAISPNNCPDGFEMVVEALRA